MAHFIGGVRGNRGEVTRLGHPKDGLTAYAASWSGSVRVFLWVREGVDYATVRLEPWHGRGKSRVLYDGPVSGREAV